MECRSVVQLIGTFADGQLEPSRGIEVDEHVASCKTCGERLALERAARASLKRAASAHAPSELRHRLRVALQAEAERTHVQAGSARFKWWQATLPLASAAAFALAWWGGGPWWSGMRARLGSGVAPNDALGDFMAEHSHPLPPERTDPREVRAFEQYVGVPVRPVSFKRGEARFIGGRVLPVHKERAAMLQYEIGQGADTRRVSVMVFDPRRIEVGGAGLSPRAIGTAEVLYGKANGYSVAVSKHDGVGYAVASDLEPESQLELVSFTDN